MNGKGFKPKYNGDVIACQLEGLRTGEMTNGRPSFTLLGYHAAVAVLADALHLPTWLSESQRHVLARETLSNAAMSPPVSAAGLIREARRALARLKDMPLQPYRVVSSINTAPGPAIRTRRILDCTIQFHGSRPTRFPYPRGVERVAPKGCSTQTIVAAVKARSPSDARLRALDAFDYLRAIWQLYRRTRPRFTYGAPPTPHSHVHNTRALTVHAPSGVLRTSSFWYESATVQTPTVFEDTEDLRSFERHVRHRVRAHREAPQLRALLRAYIRALDEADYFNTFLRLWTVLENIHQATPGGAGYDKLTRRVEALYYYEKPHRQRWVVQELKHLRLYRNALVHDSASADPREQEYLSALVGTLAKHIEASLEMLLRYATRHSQLADTLRVLDYRHELMRSPEKKSLLEEAVRMQEWRPRRRSDAPSKT